MPPTATPDPFAPARLGPIDLRNRIVKAATFEGMSPDNVVSEPLIDFHRTMAAGGVGMTTVAYLAVSRDGMGAPAEILATERAGEGLARIAAVVHGEGARISAQLGHAGAVGELPGKRVVGPSAGRTMTGAKIAAMSLGEIDQVIDEFAAGARVLADAGFDAIELHFGHHYLVSSFLSPLWNRRTDEYGGSVEGRTLFGRRILRAVRDAVGNDVALIAKMNMVDGLRRGLQIEDSIAGARILESAGVLNAIELTSGGSRANQMFMFRGDAPRAEMAQVLTGVPKVGFRVLGRWLFKEYPFEEAYFLPMARRFRAALDLPLILLGGINRRDTIEQAMAEGFDFVAMGRALLREPDLVNRMQSGAATASTCVHCNKCMVSIFSGTRCAYDHPEPLLNL